MSSVTVLALTMFIVVAGQYETCIRQSCVSPNCACPSRRGPLELSVQEIPQIVTLTFDDAVNDQNWKIYKRLLSRKRLNPNGCPIQATFFVSHDWTNYEYVKDLYLDGHEIGSHSITHRLPRNWWAEASYNQWADEMNGQRNHISKKAMIPKSVIRGLRVPFLEIGGDTQFEMMRDYGFEYDASFLAGPYNDRDWRTAVWPYTLEYAPNIEYCDNTNCPTGNHSSIWEVPLNRWIGLDGRACPMVDSCTTQNLNTHSQTLQYLWKNFNRHHTNGRAPLGVNMHATWFEKDFKLDAMDEFLGDLVARKNVYIISMYQLIEWMRMPTALSEISDFEPWKTGCKRGRMLVGKKGATKKSLRKKKGQGVKQAIKEKRRPISVEFDKNKRIRYVKDDVKDAEDTEVDQPVMDNKRKQVVKEKVNKVDVIPVEVTQKKPTNKHKKQQVQKFNLTNKHNKQPNKVINKSRSEVSNDVSKFANEGNDKSVTWRPTETQVQKVQPDTPHRNTRLYRHGYRSAEPAVVIVNSVLVTVTMVTAAMTISLASI